MKKLKYLPVILVACYILYSLGFNTIESQLFDVIIQQIQYKSPDSLVLGRDRSDLEGQNVRFIARVVAPPRVSPANNDFRTLLRGSNSWTCYAQDTSNGIFGGIVIKQFTRGPQTGLDNIDTGTIIRVSGVVQEFGSTSGASYSNVLTQIAIDTSSGYTIEIIESGNNTKRPNPIPVNITDFVTGDYPIFGTINYVEGEKYEGMYIEIRNVTAAGGIGNRQPWSIIDGSGNRMYIRDFSNFYSSSPAGDTLRQWTHPSPGTSVEYIRGVIINANNEGAFGSQLPYVIVPIYPNDLSIGNPPPQLSSPLRNPGVPTPADSVAISVTAIDLINSSAIADMKVLYRFDGGSFQSKSMYLTSNNIYSTKIPPASINTIVEYFIRAEDNSNGVTILPSDTSKSKYFYKVRLNDSMSVQDVQFCPNNGGKSAYEGIFVRGVEGIVTADTSDIPGVNFTSSAGNQTAPRRIYLQNGQGPNSGIWISGGPTDVLRKGYRVRVSGIVEENLSVTRINVPSSGLYILSLGNPLPSPEIINTSQIFNAAVDGDQSVEVWESVLLRLETPVIMQCVNASQGVTCSTMDPLPDSVFRRNFGEILVTDISNVSARIELQDGNHKFTNNWDGLNNPPQPGYTLLNRNNIISHIVGILYYSSGNYKLTPRLNPDFGNITITEIGNNIGKIDNYYLEQNYPNPFNPTTKITFNIPVSGDISIKIYDIIGREVKTLVNKLLEAGIHNVEFNGADLSSGVYFYKLEAVNMNGNNFQMTKRMVLIK